MNYTYIIRCKDDTLYTGWTNNLEKRLDDHNSGRGAKYTRGRSPITLMYTEEFASKEEALKREYAIKRMSRTEKMKLINGHGCDKLIHKHEVTEASPHTK